MIYRIIADLVLAVHFAFIVFVVFGGILAFKWRRVAWFHLPCLVWGAAIVIVGWVCPLTPLENRFRALAGQAGYETSFIEHYLLSLVYPAGLTQTIQFILGGALLLFNFLVYALVARRHSRGPGNRTR